MDNIELTFEDAQGNLVVLMPKVVQRLLAHRQLAPRNKEAAGVLIGERRGEHIVITGLSEPAKEDKRTRYSVDRCSRSHQETVDQAFSRSQGTHQYVGEWHTHPEDVPCPSPMDRRSWNNGLRDTHPMILLVVGRHKIWGARKYKGSIQRLSEI